jgi:hypothetical protein
MIIQYDSVDPTRVLDNPSHLFGDTFFDQKVNEKVGACLIDLLDHYQKLSNVNVNMTLQTIKFELQHDELQNSEVYNLLDKFYVDIPDINCVNSAWISADTLPLMIEKQNLHKSIKEKLKLLQSIFDIMKTKTTHKDKHAQSDHSSEEDEKVEEEEEIKPISQKRPKDKKKKNKKVVE